MDMEIKLHANSYDEDLELRRLCPNISRSLNWWGRDGDSVLRPILFQSLHLVQPTLPECFRIRQISHCAFRSMPREVDGPKRGGGTCTA